MQEELVGGSGVGAEAAGLAVLDECGRQEAVLYARRCVQLVASAELSARAEQADGKPRLLVLDLSGSLRVGQQAAGNALAEASWLVRAFPLLLAQLQVGAVLVPQARRVLEHTSALTLPVAREVDRRLGALWQQPAGWVGARLTRVLTRLVLHAEADLDPAAAVRRDATARAGRRVSVRTEPDGMGSLWALLPADELVVFARGLDQLAARQKIADRAAGIVRTTDQRRADVLAELPTLALHALTHSPAAQTGAQAGAGGAAGAAEAMAAPLGACRHPRAVLNVQVPMATLLGHSNAPATLDGYGPISAHQVRLLLPDASLRQVLLDRATGQVLHLDQQLVPPAHQPGTGGSGGKAGRGGGRRRVLPRQRTPDHEPEPEFEPSTTQWLGSPADRPERRTAHLHPTTPAAPLPDTPSPADQARLTRLVPIDVLVLGDAPEPTYRPSATLARLVRTRDELCTGPGCAASSTRSDLDHADPWPHGPTNALNLRPHSRRCHRAKTLTWTTTRTGDGTLHWTSPTGRTYPVPPLWQPAPTLQPARGAPPHDPNAWPTSPPDTDPAHDPWLDDLHPPTPPAPRPTPTPVRDDTPPPF